jgi:tetratricopeptide (TPR) repeat protein
LKSELEQAKSLFFEALSFIDSSDFQSAETRLRDALRFSPGSVSVLTNLAVVLLKQNKRVEARKFAEKAICADASNIEALLIMADCYTKDGNLTEALAVYNDIISLDRANPEAHNNSGVILHKLDRLLDALDSYDRAIALEPHFPDAYNNRANVLRDLRHFEEAIRDYAKALALNPNQASAWLGRGNVHCEYRRFEEALSDFGKAISLKPDLAEAWLGRGNVFCECQRFEEALPDYDRAIALKSDLAEAWVGRGNVFYALNRDEDALESYDKAINIKNDYVDAYYSKGLLKLWRGDFQEGWTLYRWRTKVSNAPVREGYSNDPIEALGISIPNDDSQIIGKNIAIIAEQGVGDEIMFASILPDVIRDANSITYQVDPRLIRFFSRNFPAVKFVSKEDPNYILSQKFDTIVRAGSLGYVYRSNSESFPRKPYLKADPTIVNRWRSILGERGNGFKVGISWRGGVAKTGRQQRSMTLNQLRPLLTRDDCMFVSLQYGDVHDEVEKYNANTSRKIAHFPKADIDDFDDLGGLIEALDVVVSVQNTVIHQCGAQGKKCLALLPWKAEWRYGKSGTQMIWYSSIELFRQSERGNWDGVLDAVSRRLSEIIKAGERVQ